MGATDTGRTGETLEQLTGQASSPPPPSFPGVLLDWRLTRWWSRGCWPRSCCTWPGCAGSPPPAGPWPLRRSVAFFSGIGVLAVALLSAVETYDSALFSVHVAQHMVLTMLAPPLIALSAPITMALLATGRDDPQAHRAARAQPPGQACSATRCWPG